MFVCVYGTGKDSFIPMNFWKAYYEFSCILFCTEMGNFVPSAEHSLIFLADLNMDIL